MALSIEEISRRAGIKGTSGSFDFSKEDKKQSRLLEDNRQFTAGGENSAGPDPRIVERKLNEKRSQVQFIKQAKKKKQTVDPISDSLVEGIRFSESSPSDRKNKTMTTYLEPARKTSKGKILPATYNIGPGLNLDSPLVKAAFKARGFDTEGLKQTFNFLEKETIPEELTPLVNDVFKDVIRSARRDAITYIGRKSDWDKLKKNEQDALIDMSYNLGLPTLAGDTNHVGFKRMRKNILHLINNRSPQAVANVLKEMQDSDWYRGIGRNVNQRALKIMDLFSQKQDEESQRFDKWAQSNSRNS